MSSNSESDTGVSSDRELSSEYRVGGYYSVEKGTVLGKRKRYTVLAKLGWGNFSTVWRCWDKRKKLEVAIKVMKADEVTTEQALDEVRLLRNAEEADPRDSARNLVVKLLEDFSVTGPHGSHTCLVMELLGRSLLTCLQASPEGRIARKNVKVVMRQVLRGLEYLHSKASIIHTDIKPENVLLALPGPRNLCQEVRGLRVKLADLGSSCWRDEQFSLAIGTQEYRAPEVILDWGYDTSADVWSAACLAYELATGVYLFPAQSEPQSEPRTVPKDAWMIARMKALLGKFPKTLRRHYGFFQKSVGGDKVQDLASTSLQGMLEQEQGWEKQEAADFSRWLLPMLALDPQVRASAGVAASHPFLGLELRRARTLVRMEEYQHVTEPGLPPLCVKMADSLMEEVFDKIAKKGFCSGKAILKFTCARYPGYGCRIKKFKVRGALDWLVALRKLVQVSGKGLGGTYRRAKRHLGEEGNRSSPRNLVASRRY